MAPEPNQLSSKDDKGTNNPPANIQQTIDFVAPLETGDQGDLQLTTSYHGVKAIVGNDPGKLPDKIGRFKVIKLLGSGGFGNVYLSFDTNLVKDKTVDPAQVPDGALRALKVPHNSITQQAAEAYRQEAITLATLHDPKINIVPVYELSTETGVFCIVSQFIDGGDRNSKDLKTYLKSLPNKRMPYIEAVQLILDLLPAVSHCHDKDGGYVHRDIKPGNIFIARDGKIWLGDLGLALRETTAPVKGMMAGTLDYMAPEVLLGNAGIPDRRMDIYSLGALLYQMVSGYPPFNGLDENRKFHQQILVDRITSSIPAPSLRNDPALRTTIPKELDQMILRALSKKIEDRFSGVDDLAEALKNLLDKEKDKVKKKTAPAPAPRGRSTKAKAALAAAAATVGTALVLGGTLFTETLLSRNGNNDQTPAPIKKDQPEDYPAYNDGDFDKFKEWPLVEGQDKTTINLYKLAGFLYKNMRGKAQELIQIDDRNPDGTLIMNPDGTIKQKLVFNNWQNYQQLVRELLEDNSPKVVNVPSIEELDGARKAFNFMGRVADRAKRELPGNPGERVLGMKKLDWINFVKTGEPGKETFELSEGKAKEFWKEQTDWIKSVQKDCPYWIKLADGDPDINKQLSDGFDSIIRQTQKADIQIDNVSGLTYMKKSPRRQK